jgi:diguanylate cyclase (GGDEF)-like protein/PAS domain S-box-containing protein
MSKPIRTGRVDPQALVGLWPLVDDIDACFYIKDPDGRYTFVNRCAARMFDADVSNIVGKTDADFFDGSVLPHIQEADSKVLRHGKKISYDETLSLRNGERRVFRTAKLPMFDDQRRIVGMLGVSIDITERQRAIDQLVRENALLDIILANVDASVYLKDRSGRYLYANRQVIDLFGRPLGEIIGHTDAELLAPEVAQEVAQFDQKVLTGRGRKAREETLVDAHGRTRNFWTTKMALELPDQPTCLIGFSTEITELLSLRRLLAHERITDTLTGLPNRVMFESAVDEQLATAPGTENIAVVIADIDQFKYINTNFGQPAGDRLIQQVGIRLQHCGASIQHLARLTGDEFAFLIRHAADMDKLAATVDEVLARLSQPYAFDHQDLHLTFSAGISVFREDGRSAAELLAHAEVAMYSAKDNGRAQYRFYSRALGSRIVERVELERDLRSAIGTDQFELHYQPKVGRDGSVAGVEALIRWHRPRMGMVRPDQFIPLAEQLGLLRPLGRWVIAQACGQAAAWAREGLGNIPIAVNLSTSQLTSPGLPDYIFRTLREHKVADGCLEMEITESMMMADPDAAIGMLHRLREGGVALSIDDFGTGFSSMTYLRDLPANYLKLDRSFVKNIASDAKDADLCAGITALAHKLDMHVVAEGIETQEQFRALVSSECDFFQGFFFSKPLNAERATQFLRAATRSAPSV